MDRNAEFEWDRLKNESNLRKHGVSFEEATEIFADPFLEIAYDPDHSDDEDRFISLGMTRRGVIIAVIHTDRFGRIRIISARLATKREVDFYEQEHR